MCERIQQFHLSKLADISEVREPFAISVSKQQKHQTGKFATSDGKQQKHQTLGKLAVSESQQQSIKSDKSAVSPSKQPKQKRHQNWEVFQFHKANSKRTKP